MAIFKSKQTKCEDDFKVRLCGKRLYSAESGKYLWVKIDANLNWQCQVIDLSVKLNRVNAFLFKVRKYVSLKILKSIYFAVFESHLSCCPLLWLRILELFNRLWFYKKRLLESLISNQRISILVSYLNITLF